MVDMPYALRLTPYAFPLFPKIFSTMKPKHILAYISICITCSSCFTRWVMSEGEVKKHYASRPVKPTFFTIKNDSVELFCATTGNDTLPPLLLIHGAPGGWFSNISLVDDPDLQARYHIISVSRPGYHKFSPALRSPRPSGVKRSPVASQLPPQAPARR